MDIAMAPPVKRRKLSNKSFLGIHRENCTESLDVSYFPSSAQSLCIENNPTLERTSHQTEVERQQEVRPAVGGVEDFKVLLPRQGTLASVAGGVSVSVAPTIAYVDASTTITYTPPATPSLPTLPSISGATTFSTTSTSIGSTSPTDAASNSNSISSSNTTSESTSLSASTGASSSHGLTTSAATYESNSTSSTSRTTSAVTSASTGTDFVITLSNGDTATVTRFRTAYTTTFVDGEIFTIPGLLSSSSTGRSITTSMSNGEYDSVTSTALATDVATAGGYGTPVTSAPSSSTSPGLTSSNDGHNNNDTPPAGTIAGGVVGGCAGLAVIVLVAMLFVRWYRRRSQLGHQALPPSSADFPGEGQPGELSRGPGMAERAGLMPFAAAVPALFRHQNRSTEPSESSERGFTRISGRKLPSAWSEGMSSPPPTMPFNATGASDPEARDMGSTSFYREDHGFYGEENTATLPISPTASATSPASTHGPLRSSTHEMMTMSPGPQRHPQVHGPYSIPGGMQSPTGPPAGFQRSDTPSSLDPTRNSRFTEEM